MSVVLLLAALSAANPVRDPFWPVGYEGTRRVISAEPRHAQSVVTNAAPVQAAAEDPDAEALARVANEENIRRQLAMSKRWNEALKTLRFGGLIQRPAEGGRPATSAVLVNGRSCAEGDLVRIDFEGYRFIWRVSAGGADHKLHLSRVKAVRLDEIKGSNK